MPQIGAISSGVKSFTLSLQLLEILGMRLDVLLVVQPLGDDDVEHGVQQRHVAAGLELQHVGGMALQRLAARVHDDRASRRAWPRS